NDVQIDLAAVVGRTVTEVLLVLDAPADPDADLLDEVEGSPPDAPELTGWVDGPYLAPRPADPPLADPVARVDTRRRPTAAAAVSRGTTLPLTAMPHGFALFTPATDARPRRRRYGYHRANGPDTPPRLQAMALSHQPSSWMGDRHQFLMMPLL